MTDLRLHGRRSAIFLYVAARPRFIIEGNGMTQKDTMICVIVTAAIMGVIFIYLLLAGH
jgi:hypothetical protein